MITTTEIMQDKCMSFFHLIQQLIYASITPTDPHNKVLLCCIVTSALVWPKIVHVFMWTLSAKHQLNNLRNAKTLIKTASYGQKPSKILFLVAKFQKIFFKMWMKHVLIIVEILYFFMAELWNWFNFRLPPKWFIYNHHIELQWNNMVGTEKVSNWTN